MHLLVRTRLTAIEPPELALTVQGKARVRVRGQVCGYVQCADQRRWAWGAFDQTFQLARTQGSLEVRVLGLGGVAWQTVRFRTEVDLRLVRLPAALGRLRWARVRVPAVFRSRANPRASTAALTAQAIRALSGAEKR